jgi:hypothetical protein
MRQTWRPRRLRRSLPRIGFRPKPLRLVRIAPAQSGRSSQRQGVIRTASRSLRQPVPQAAQAGQSLADGGLKIEDHVLHSFSEFKHVIVTAALFENLDDLLD